MTPERQKRAFEIFDAAIAQPDPDRERFVAMTCAGDKELEAEVRSLLAAHSDASGFLSGAPTPSGPTIGRRANAARAAKTGDRLGAFVIESFIGAGGMGEVYRARDVRLDRHVAIKVLLADSGADPRRRERFTSEARAIARISHPNICALHDVGQHDGIDFLVMEYLEGEPLSERLRKGPLPLGEALRVALEIGRALVAAHARGIVHRDLKPGNVMLTRTGTKLLDFGLARLRAPAAADGTTMSGAPPSSHTTPGLIVGTVQYMSPEQLEGKDVDARADIFAFGALLYEMVIGHRAFQGDTSASVISAIMSTYPPPISSLQPLAPPALDRVVRKCLEKNRDDRWSSMHDVLAVLEWIKEDGGGLVATARRGRSRVWWQLWPLVALLFLAVIAAAWVLGRQSARAPLVAHLEVLTVLPPQGTTLAYEEPPAVSPDGSKVVFVAHDGPGRRLLYLFTRGSLRSPEPLPDTMGASLPFWAPSNQSIGFFAEGSLKRLDIGTNRARRLATASGPRGGSWSADGQIVFVPFPPLGPHVIPAEGGIDPKRIEFETAGARGWYPFFLPDGKHFLLWVPSPRQPDEAAVYVMSLDGKLRRELLKSRSHAVYSDGQLLFWRDGALFAQRFDAQQLTTVGDPVAFPGAVGVNPLINIGLHAVASSASALAFNSGSSLQTQLIWLNRSGIRQATPGPTGVINSLSLAPDDSQVVYDAADPRTASMDLFRYSFATRQPTRITFNPSIDMYPIWSADGARIIFSSLRDGIPNLYQIDADGAGNDRLLLKTGEPKNPTGTSPDGARVLYTMRQAIWSAAIADAANATVLIDHDRADERYATVSPDGRLVTYISNENGAYQVYVRDYPQGRSIRQISVEGGTQPSWRRDGKELFYIAPDHTLMAVEIKSASPFDHGAPRRLFAVRTRQLESQPMATHYAVSRDGQRFLFATTPAETQPDPITLILNWTTLLDK